jgi:copper chaperone CopZ
MKSLILLSFFAFNQVWAETATLNIKGMTCGGCVKNIEKAVCQGLNYSKDNCQVEIGKITVTGDQIDLGAVEAAITKAGYEPVTTAASAKASAPALDTPAQSTAKPSSKKK